MSAKSLKKIVLVLLCVLLVSLCVLSVQVRADETSVDTGGVTVSPGYNGSTTDTWETKNCAL